MSVLFVLVDALRHDYLDYHGSAKFLSKCSKNGLYIKKVLPSLGFCERIEILTGVGFPQNGYYSAIGKTNSAYGPYRILEHLHPVIGNSKYFRKVIKKTSSYLGLKLNPYEIPINLLPYLTLTEDLKDHQKQNAFQYESITDVLIKYNKSLNWHFTALGLQNGDDRKRVKDLKNSLNSNKYDLSMLYIGALDIEAHRHGPCSVEVGEQLMIIDQQIEEVYSFAVERNPDMKLFVLGDHGMAEVNKPLDVWGIVVQVARQSSIILWKDIDIFLDSTSCRIWIKNKKSFNKINIFLKNIQHRLKKYGCILECSYNKELYGDYVWIFNEGVIVFPDFFHIRGKPYKGMHGYDPTGKNMAGLGLVYDGGKNINRQIVDKGSLSDVANTICDLLSVRRPVSSLGKSWLL